MCCISTYNNVGCPPPQPKLLNLRNIDDDYMHIYVF